MGDEMPHADRAASHSLVTAEAALDLIAKVSHTVVDRAPMFVRLHEAANHIRHAFQVDGCVMRELMGDSLYLTACSGMHEDLLPVKMSAQTPLAARVLASKQALTLSDVPTDPLTASLHEAARGKWFQFTSYAGAPMMVQGRSIGILGIFSTDPKRVFQEKETYYLQIVANHLAVCLQNHRLYSELKTQRDNLKQRLNDQRVQRTPYPASIAKLTPEQ